MARTDTKDDKNYKARLLQMRPEAIAANHAKMESAGAYCLVKAVTLVDDLPARCERGGYFTMLAELSGKTPDEMRRHLGLRAFDLASGAGIYRLLAVPQPGQFAPRGYSGLVGGLPHDADPKLGYAPGSAAWQAVLLDAVPMVLAARVLPNERFDPGPHPRYRVAGGK